MTHGEPGLDVGAVADEIGRLTHESMQRDTQAAVVFGRAMASLDITSIADLIPDFAGINDLPKVNAPLLRDRFSVDQVTAAVSALREGSWFELPSLRLEESSQNPDVTDTELLTVAIRMGTFVGHMTKVQRMHELRQMGMAEADIESTITEESKRGLSTMLFGTIMKAEATIERLNGRGQ